MHPVHTHRAMGKTLRVHPRMTQKKLTRHILRPIASALFLFLDPALECWGANLFGIKKRHTITWTTMTSLPFAQKTEAKLDCYIGEFPPKKIQINPPEYQKAFEKFANINPPAAVNSFCCQRNSKRYTCTHKRERKRNRSNILHNKFRDRSAYTFQTSAPPSHVRNARPFDGARRNSAGDCQKKWRYNDQGGRNVIRVRMRQLVALVPGWHSEPSERRNDSRHHLIWKTNSGRWSLRPTARNPINPPKSYS